MKNKTLFITGGNEGIGLATALLFAEHGVNIAIMGRRADKNVEAQKLIAAKGVKCIAINGDVTSEGDMSSAIERVVGTFGGSIVNTGSMASAVGMPMLPLYVASKHGLLGMTKSAALEYARQGVRINMVSPGTTRGTGIHSNMAKTAPHVEEMLLQMVPMGRLCTPDEIAGTVLYLCSHAASYVTGQAIYVDGGITVP